MTKKKSKYVPKPVITDPMDWIKQGMQRVADNKHAVVLKLRNHDALVETTQGRADKAVMSVLIAAMNMAEALLIVNPKELGGHLKQDIYLAQDALFDMGRRGIIRGSFLFTGQELQAINIGMEIHDLQLEVCTVRELENAMAIVSARLRSTKVRRIAHD